MQTIVSGMAAYSRLQRLLNCRCSAKPLPGRKASPISDWQWLRGVGTQQNELDDLRTEERKRQEKERRRQEKGEKERMKWVRMGTSKLQSGAVYPPVVGFWHDCAKSPSPMLLRRHTHHTLSKILAYSESIARICAQGWPRRATHWKSDEQLCSNRSEKSRKTGAHSSEQTPANIGAP